MYQNRTYRNLLNPKNLISFQATVKETDLYIHATKQLSGITKELIFQHRRFIERYIELFPEFSTTLVPWYNSIGAPKIIQNMAKASIKAGVGPMAAVAGAIAEEVGNDLLSYTDEVIVENGGDIFLKTNNPVTIGIFSGKSALSLRIGLQLEPENHPVSVCTSSGTVGHSLSFGKADAVCVISDSCPLADAAATSICNYVKSINEIEEAINYGKTIKGIIGIVVIMRDKIGLWGKIKIVPLN